MSVLESINLPLLALPILQPGQALVDGGLLNNVPAKVLAAKGCNFVIASTVTARLEQVFIGIRSHLQVIMHQYMIQDYNMNSVRVQPADFVIAPAVTAFDMADFARAEEMARIGETTTMATVAQLRTMLGKLDAELFESP